MSKDLIIFEQCRYDRVVSVINEFVGSKFVREKVLRDLDELIDSLLEDIDEERRGL